MAIMYHLSCILLNYVLTDRRTDITERQATDEEVLH